MGALKEYILGIICSTLIVAVIGTIPFKSGQIKAVIKVISGIAVTLSVLSPIMDLSLSGLTNFGSYISVDADTLVAMGKEMSAQEQKKLISEYTETYILDKAASLDAVIAVEVVLSDADPYVPVSASITGRVAPYAKKVISDFMEQELGIKREDQLWISDNIPEN